MSDLVGGARSLKSKYQHCSSPGLTGSRTKLSMGSSLNSLATKDPENRADDRTKYISYDGKGGIGSEHHTQQQFNTYVGDQ